MIYGLGGGWLAGSNGLRYTPRILRFFADGLREEISMLGALYLISRRRFVAGILVGVLAAAPPYASAQHNSPAPSRFALFSDTHIAGDRDFEARGVKMADHFAQAVREVLQCDPRPTAVLMCGDCAYLKGTAEDYATLRALLEPLRAAGIGVYAALGNHDNRERYLRIVGHGRSAPSPVKNRHVTLLQAPLANWFLLDSLDQTNKTPGVLGGAQLDWLARTLDEHTDKPALIMVHHNPDWRPKPSGLVETEELLKVLADRPQVKALFFGHSHRFSVTKRKTLYLVNLPALAYVFSKDQPSAWTDARLRADGMTLQLHCINKDHPMDGKRIDLSWSE